MTAPAKPLRRRSADPVLWAASAVMALTAVILGALLRPAISNAEPNALFPTTVEQSSAPAFRQDGARPAGPMIQAAEPADGRDARFLARLNALRSLQRVLARAFAPAASTPKPAAAASPHLLRVARGASPRACLAQAVYYEARGEPAEGQAAVAQVVLNRTRSGRHPADVCGVVFEGAAHAGCQFSFACDPHLGGRRPELLAWRRAETVASQALTGPGRPELAGALNYHADYVKPRWAAQLERTAEIGRHIFYAAARPAGRALAGWSFTPPPSPASGA